MNPTRYLIFGENSTATASGRMTRAIFHSARGRLLSVDVETAEALSGSAPMSALGPKTRERLVELGLLVAEEADEAAAYINDGRAAAQSLAVRTFVIMPTAYCNMGCGYCGQTHLRGAGPTGRHRAALATRVEHAAATGRYESLVVRWFGAEPMMGFPAVRSLSADFVESAARHGVGYQAIMATNGTLLSQERIRTLHLDCRVSQLEITLDGSMASHERSRPLKNGGTSFHNIVNTVSAALRDPDLARLRFTIRTNISVDNAHDARPFAAAMRAGGLSHPRVAFYPAPVHSWGNDVSAYTLRLSELAQVELEWYQAYLDERLHCELLPRATKPVVCTATTRHAEVVGPQGQIFSCTEQPLVPGQEDAHLATVDGHDPAELRPIGRFDDWYEGLASNETGCRDCAILPLCGGACPKLWREGHPPCPPLKLNLPQRIDMFVKARMQRMSELDG